MPLSFKFPVPTSCRSSMNSLNIRMDKHEAAPSKCIRSLGLMADDDLFNRGAESTSPSAACTVYIIRYVFVFHLCRVHIKVNLGTYYCKNKATARKKEGKKQRLTAGGDSGVLTMIDGRNTTDLSVPLWLEDEPLKSTFLSHLWIKKINIQSICST